MYQFYFTISKMNETINTFFVSPVILTSYFDVMLNNAVEVSVFVSGCCHEKIHCLWLSENGF